MSLDSVKWIELIHQVDSRGVLTVVDGDVIPFRIARVFYVHTIPAGAERGGHAHQATQQVAISICGSLKMDLSDGYETQTRELNNPNVGLFIPEMTWVRMYDFSNSAVCLVLADTPYDMSKSVRSWEEFLNRVRR